MRLYYFMHRGYYNMKRVVRVVVGSDWFPHHVIKDAYDEFPIGAKVKITIETETKRTYK